MTQLVPLSSPVLLKAFNAAFSEKYLSVSEVNKYSVSEAAEETVKVSGALAPRYIANVMLGAVRIFGCQVEALYAAVRKELASIMKPLQDAFQAPKASRVAATTLTAAAATPCSTTLSESMLQLEPVSIEVPRLQARETDISFEEWQDASARTSVPRSRSSDIARSETFLHDLQLEETDALNLPEDTAAVPEADFSPAPTVADKENVKPRLKLHPFIRTDPSTVLSRAVVADCRKHREDIVKYPAFVAPPGTAGKVDVGDTWLPQGFRKLLKAETFALLQPEVEEPPASQEADDPEAFVPMDYQPVEVQEAIEADEPEDYRDDMDPVVSRPSHISDANPNDLGQRTHKMLIFLQEKLRHAKRLSFAELTASKPQTMQASAFYELLQLVQTGHITLSQSAEFGDIEVRSNFR